jgi:hypothetical protein
VKGEPALETLSVRELKEIVASAPDSRHDWTRRQKAAWIELLSRARGTQGSAGDSESSTDDRG